MNTTFHQQLLKVTQATACEEVAVIQSLWSGYGKISRYALQGASRKTVVVKCIALNQVNAHPRGWNSDIGHLRKVKSYQVETHWYQEWSAQTNDACRIPAFLGAFTEGENQWIILEDLDANFPLCLNQLDIKGVYVCLRWLAHFHARFMGCKPIGLWQVGTYWHLETRPEEFEKIENSTLKAHAAALDERLSNCTFQTLVHGDAKLANFCFTTDQRKVAAVDFQYVGGGCGMKDVAYFLGSCLSSEACAKHDNEFLDVYFLALREALEEKQGTLNVDVLEQEWRKMYSVAWADFTRFLLGWMPTHQKINAYSRKMVAEALAQL